MAAGLGTSAEARRTVVDNGTQTNVGGYCAPNGFGYADCIPQALPFSITIGGQTYDSFVVNGNGTLSLGSPLTYYSNTLTDYTQPVFSPLIDNTLLTVFDSVTQSFNTDTLRAASSAAGYAMINGELVPTLTATWFTCLSSLACSDPDFGLTLTQLASGFQLDYFYSSYLSPNLSIDYGFSLPGGAQLQENGIPQPRTFIFDADGQLVVPSAVPEPATWAMMLLGFGALGLSLRRQRFRRWQPA